MRLVRRWEESWRTNRNWHTAICESQIQQDDLVRAYMSALSPTQEADLTPALLKPFQDSAIWSRFKFKGCNGDSYEIPIEPLVRDRVG